MNFLEHSADFEDGHHDVMIEGVNLDEPLTLYKHPYQGYLVQDEEALFQGHPSHEIHHHEAIVEDMNPDDHDLHHGP